MISVKCEIHAGGDESFDSVASHIIGRNVFCIEAIDPQTSGDAHLLISFEDGSQAKIYMDHFYNKRIEFEYKP
jgi:hypothetical protein